VFNFGSCGWLTRDKEIVCQEKKSKFIGLNKKEKEILKVQIDHCLTIEGKRCDWLLIDVGGQIAHFIELKGCDARQALLQLENSIAIIANPQKGFIQKKFYGQHAYIVPCRTQISGADIQNAKINFRKKYKTTLNIKNNLLKKEL
jgi:hypothetical protein